MIQRQLILQAWQRRNQNRLPSPQQKRAQEFFNLVAKSDLCWPDLNSEFRRNYYDAFDEIVPVLLDTDDPLIVYNSVKAADLTSPKEADLARKLIGTCDAAKHEATLQALAQHPEFHSALVQRGKLPDSVRAAMKNATPGRRRTSAAVK